MTILPLRMSAMTASMESNLVFISRNKANRNGAKSHIIRGIYAAIFNFCLSAGQ
jgi:hypothetical protein